MIEPTQNWRKNAYRMNQKEGEKTDFEYREGARGTMIRLLGTSLSLVFSWSFHHRYRYGEAPSSGLKGYDNTAHFTSK